MAEALRRGDNRTDPIVEDMMGDPGVRDAIDTVKSGYYNRMQQAVGEAIAKTDSRRLKGWITVAVWENADGSEDHTMLADDDSTALELKGYLHDGVWMAAHSD